MDTTEQRVKKILYKPGWEFSYESSPEMLVIKMLVQDAWPPHQMCEFTVKRIVPDYLDTNELFKKWLKGVMADVEMHELREFLRFDGELVDTPHDMLH